MNFLSGFMNHLNITGISQLSDGTFWYRLWGGETEFKNYTTTAHKMQAILKNPAALYMFVLLPELFSMGRYKLINPKGETVEKDPLLTLLKDPNPMQTNAQFKWDYMFWRKMGTANLYVHSKRVKETNKLYFLSPDGLTWSQYFTDNRNTIFLSKTAINDLMSQSITYTTGKQKLTFQYKNLIQYFDLSNGLGDWFQSPSRVDALYKIIQNSDEALNAKQRNTNFMRKFIVAGKASVEAVGTKLMDPLEKKDIETKIKSDKDIHAMRSMVDIKRFIEDYSVIGALDKSFMNDAFLIGKILNVPKDVIEMLGDSTYENQEKARASIIAYCLQPDADDLCERIISYFGEEYKDWTLQLDFSHLPFVQVFEAEKAKVNKTNAEALVKLVDAGADQTQAAELLGFEIDMVNPRNESRSNNGSQEQE